jgi:uncharacterized membrane protein
MADVPVQAIIAAFDSEEAADKALQELKALQKEKAIKIKDAAVLRRDADSKLHIKEPGEITGKKGAVVGGVTGALLGVIAGPVGWAALGGAAIGGLVGKLRDSGFDNKRLEEWGANLTPGSSAIVAVIEHTWVREVEALLREEAKDVISLAVGNEIAAQLDEQQT